MRRRRDEHERIARGERRRGVGEFARRGERRQWIESEVGHAGRYELALARRRWKAAVGVGKKRGRHVEPHPAALEEPLERHAGEPFARRGERLTDHRQIVVLEARVGEAHPRRKTAEDLAVWQRLAKRVDRRTVQREVMMAV